MERLMDVRYCYRLRKALIEYHRFIKDTKGKKRCVFMATPRHKNLGDHAIVRAQYKFLRDIEPDIKIFEFSLLEFETYRRIIRMMTPKDILIVADGGGNLGTLWPNEDKAINNIITDYRYNPVIIFPQTAYYSGDNADEHIKGFADNVNSHRSILFMVRDTKSYELFRDRIKADKILLCPDIVLYTNDAIDRRKIIVENTVGLCIRDDKESNVSVEQKGTIPTLLENKGLSYRSLTTISEKNIYPAEREEVLKKKWDEFATCRLIITDRLHGMIFSAITSTPCIALDNLSNKVSGGYEWIKALDYISFCKEADSLNDIIDGKLKEQENDNEHYDRDMVVSDKFVKCKMFLESIWQ
jgi:pyruvyl transferase EpsI